MFEDRNKWLKKMEDYPAVKNNDIVKSAGKMDGIRNTIILSDVT